MHVQSHITSTLAPSSLYLLFSHPAWFLSTWKTFFLIHSLPHGRYVLVSRSNTSALRSVSESMYVYRSWMSYVMFFKSGLSCLSLASYILTTPSMPPFTDSKSKYVREFGSRVYCTRMMVCLACRNSAYKLRDMEERGIYSISSVNAGRLKPSHRHY